MQIVINIDEEDYKVICNEAHHSVGYDTPVDNAMVAIANGKPLSKRHGELVDIRPLMRGLYEEIQVGELTYTTSEVYKMLEEETSTIIEADTE